MMNCMFQCQFTWRTAAGAHSVLFVKRRTKKNKSPPSRFFLFLELCEWWVWWRWRWSSQAQAQGLCGSQAQVFFIFESGVGANSCDCAVMLRGWSEWGATRTRVISCAVSFSFPLQDQGCKDSKTEVLVLAVLHAITMQPTQIKKKAHHNHNPSFCCCCLMPT